MELILVRHSITQGNVEKRYIGVTDSPIIPAGVSLAQAVAPLLPVPDHVYVSPLLRCVQTADIIWPNISKTVVPGLIEMNFGPFEGKNHRELLDDPQYKRWLDNPDAFDLVESINDTAERAANAISEIIRNVLDISSIKRIGIVSHGGVIGSLLAEFGSPKRESFYDWSLPNCGGFLATVSTDPLTLHVSRPIGNSQDLYSYLNPDGD